MRKILKHIETTTPSCDYKIGVSDESDDIAKALEYMDESFNCTTNVYRQENDTL